jgi:hypothetical protein
LVENFNHITLFVEASTGTEKQHVAYDYAKMLSEGNAECQTVMSDSISTLTRGLLLSLNHASRHASKDAQPLSRSLTALLSTRAFATQPRQVFSTTFT